MKKTWYFGAFLILFTLLGFYQNHNSEPNQEIVLKFSDVDIEYERLMALGIKSFTGKPKTFSFGIRNFYITDPEGNLLEIGSMGQEETG